MQPRSPTYPSLTLALAIDYAGKLHEKNRTNPIDREVAAKDLGYSGLTGSSTKALADLVHFGLVSKAGKGAIRLSQRAIDILYPESEDGKKKAIQDAAYSPALFGALRQHFSDGVPSEAALKSYLVRQQFMASAIPSVITSYLETSRLVQQSNASESHRQPETRVSNSVGGDTEPETSGDQAPAPAPSEARLARAAPPIVRGDQLQMAEGEREIATGSLSKHTSFRVIVNGRMGLKEFDRLIRKLEFDKEIMADDEKDGGPVKDAEY